MIPVAIFTSQTDIPWAGKCAAHMESLGFRPHVITGIGQGSLMGPVVARGMVAAMIEIAEGGIVAKCDADSKVTPAGATWLQSATEQEARAFYMGHGNTCIAFSAHVTRLRIIHDWLEGGYGNGCASCTICYGLRAPAVSGGTIQRQRGAFRFSAGTVFPEGAMIATLTPHELPESRYVNMADLWR